MHKHLRWFSTGRNSYVIHRLEVYGENGFPIYLKVSETATVFTTLLVGQTNENLIWKNELRWHPLNINVIFRSKCVFLTIFKNEENNGTEEIGLVTPPLVIGPEMIDETSNEYVAVTTTKQDTTIPHAHWFNTLYITATSVITAVTQSMRGRYTAGLFWLQRNNIQIDTKRHRGSPVLTFISDFSNH